MARPKSPRKKPEGAGPKVVKQIIVGQGSSGSAGATVGGDAPAENVLSKVERAAASGAAPDPEVYSKFLQQMMSGKASAEELAKAEVDPEVKEIAEWLAIIHLPEWRTPGGGRKLADPSRFELRQSLRLAQYMHDSGFRMHEDLQQVRWEETPGGGGPHDLGIHVWRDENGEWPAPDPEEIFDLESIELSQDPDSGEWVARHPSGLFERNVSKAKAHAGLSLQLADRIEAATAGDVDGEGACL